MSKALVKIKQKQKIGINQAVVVLSEKSLQSHATTGRDAFSVIWIFVSVIVFSKFDLRCTAEQTDTQESSLLIFEGDDIVAVEEAILTVSLLPKQLQCDFTVGLYNWAFRPLAIFSIASLRCITQ